MAHALEWPVAAALVCALFVALLLVAERRDSERGRWATKPFASLAFIVAGYVSLPLDTTFGKLLFGGLLLSAVGDVLLVRMQSNAWFMAGTNVFVLAHLAYSAAFVARGVSVFAIEGAALPALIMIAVVLAWLVPRVPAAMKIPIVGYAFVISAMVVLAVGTFASGGGASLVVGALAFYLSDLAVARDRFVQTAFVNRAWGLPLYYGAQLVLATSERF